MNVFLEIFSKFLEQPFCRTLPVSCFSSLLKSSGWMTVISFFFGHLSVFWVFFSSFRVTLRLLAINVEKPLGTFIFFALTEKNISLFGGEVLLRQLSFNQSIKIHGLFLQYFTESLRVKIFFFYRGFLSQPFTNHRTAGEGGGHFFNSSLPLPPASQTLRH